MATATTHAGAPSLPLVSIVIVTHNGAHHLRTLLPALLAPDYPHREIIVVDNASTDGSAAYLAALAPAVHLVRAPRNLGFAGGNHLGIAAARGAYLMLLNNDTAVEPGWLQPLVDELERDPAVAMAGPKITFLKPYVRLTLRAPVFRTVNDGRELGLRVSTETHVDGCTYHKPFFAAGFHAREQQGGQAWHWSGATAELLLPFEPGPGDRTLVLKAGGSAECAGVACHVEFAGQTIGTAQLSGEFTTHRFILLAADVARHGRYVINNAGTVLDAQGTASDRGFGEADEGQYDRAEDVTALCGCALLARRSAFARAGGFDPSFFMYYEDTDLSWRLRRAGYRLRYQPASVIRHVHAGTSCEGSPLFRFHVARNRLLLLLKNAPWRCVARAWYNELRGVAGILRAWRRDRETRAGVLLRLHVLGSALCHAPAAIARRRVR